MTQSAPLAAMAALSELMRSQHNLIPHMDWEKHAMDLAGGSITISQLRFVVALFSSVLVGAGIRLVSNPTARHIYSFVTGFLLCYYPFGANMTQALPPMILTYLAMLFAPRRCSAIAWVINFPFLIYLHVINASGEAWNQGQMDFTGGSMILFFKLVTLATCYQDHFSTKPLTDWQRSVKVDRVPSLLEFLSFTFSFGNLLCGPYLEFTHYINFIEHKETWDFKGQGRRAPSFLLPCLMQFGAGLLFMAGKLYLEPLYGVALMATAWYKAQPLLVRLVLMWPMGVVQQMRYYFVWSISEASLTASGINLEKTDDKGKAVWGRYRNVRFWSVQTSDSSRLLVSHWNILTSVFLRRYVYERITPAGKKPGFKELLVTQMVSGVWHGLYPGYLLMFASSALMLAGSSAIYKIEHAIMPAGLRTSLPWCFIKLVQTHVTLDYLAMAFVILDWDGTLAVWRDVKFLPHIILVVLIVLGMGFKTPKPSRSKDAAKKAE